jgi:8-oxo-dGTP pyrophosphatase MutT (NUDIX family)
VAGLDEACAKPPRARLAKAGAARQAEAVPAAPTPEVPIALAATVVVTRDGAGGVEVLLVQRAQSLAFHGGAWVFPGGRVDPGDAAFDADRRVDELTTARRAAVRETHEEAGLRVAPEELVPFSHWTTPRGRTRRFATWFFAAHLRIPRDVVIDGSEITAHRWLSAREALALQAHGDFELPPPTFVTLTKFARFGSSAALIDALRAAPPIVYVPRLVGDVALYEGDVAYESGALDQPGARHRLHMGAGPWRYELPAERG